MFTFSVTRSRQSNVQPNDLSRREDTNMAADVQQATDANQDPIVPTGVQQATNAHPDAIIPADIQPVGDPDKNQPTVNDLEIQIEYDEPLNVVAPIVEQPVVADFGPENQETLRQEIEAEYGPLPIRPEHVRRMEDILDDRDGNQQPGEEAANQPQQEAQNRNVAPDNDVNARPVSKVQKTRLTFRF